MFVFYCLTAAALCAPGHRWFENGKEILEKYLKIVALGGIGIIAVVAISSNMSDKVQGDRQLFELLLRYGFFLGSNMYI